MLSFTDVSRVREVTTLIWHGIVSLALSRPPSLTAPPCPAHNTSDKLDDVIISRSAHAVEVLVTISIALFPSDSVLCAFGSLLEILTKMLLLPGEFEGSHQLAAHSSDLDTRSRR